jgi:hypothetical protein
MPVAGHTLRIGGNDSYGWNGLIDEIRITSGLARYTANTITPPQYSFPKQANATNARVNIAVTSPVDGDFLVFDQPSGKFINRAPDVEPVSFSLNVPGELYTTTAINRWYAPSDINLTDVYAWVSLPPAGTSIVVKIRKNGIIVDEINIAAGQQYVTQPVTWDLVEGDYITVDILQVGNIYAGKNLTIKFVGEKV